MYDDPPADRSPDLFLRSVWGGSALGEPTIGYAETVSANTRQSILDYMASKYVPSAIVITAVGHVDHASFVDETARRFGALRGGPPQQDPKPPVFRPVSVIKQKACEQVYVLVGAEGASASDERRYILSVLDTILGGGMASR